MAIKRSKRVKNLRTKKLKRTLGKSRKNLKTKGGRIESQNNQLFGANPWGAAEVRLLRFLGIEYNGPDQHMVDTESFWSKPTIVATGFNMSFFDAYMGTLALLGPQSLNRIIQLMDAVITSRDADAGRHAEASGTHADYYSTFATVRFILNNVRQSGQPLTHQMLLNMDLPGTDENTERTELHTAFLERNDTIQPSPARNVYDESFETSFAPNAYSRHPDEEEFENVGHVPTHEYAPQVEVRDPQDEGKRGQARARRNQGLFKPPDKSDY